MLFYADDYGALEPAISGKIMELHHSKHHQTYVNSYNAALEKMEELQAKSDIQGQIAQQPLINFHGGASYISLAHVLRSSLDVIKAK